ncbi:unnamed protein product [Effrenium voratum]|nr:unnamed protein product [Effrenium voratum]
MLHGGTGVCGAVQVRKRCAPKEGGIWSFRTGRAQYHRARCQLGGVLVRSGSVPCRAQAEQLLARLRRTALETLPLEQRLAAAAEALCVERAEVSFVVTLDARRWLGRNIESPTLRSLEETLHWRRRADEAEAAGWPGVRELWNDWQCLCRPKQLQHRRRSASELQRLQHAGDLENQRREARRPSLQSAQQQAEQLLSRAMARPRSRKRQVILRAVKRRTH